MSDGREVPYHKSGGAMRVGDPDETAGRALYRAQGDALARADIARNRYKARLLGDECAALTANHSAPVVEE